MTAINLITSSLAVQKNLFFGFFLGTEHRNCNKDIGEGGVTVVQSAGVELHWNNKSVFVGVDGRKKG